MCYVIELTDKYLSSNAPTVTVKRNKGVKMEYVKWTMTSDHDYLGLSHNKMWIDFKPFKFTSKFGDIMSQKITAVQTIRSPLNCTMYNANYTSEQQCMANDFFDKNFSPCPLKCIPIQMRGFRYVNSFSALTLRTATNWKMKFVMADQLFGKNLTNISKNAKNHAKSAHMGGFQLQDKS